MISLLNADAFPEVSTALITIAFGPSPWQYVIGHERHLPGHVGHRHGTYRTSAGCERLIPCARHRESKGAIPK